MAISRYRSRAIIIDKAAKTITLEADNYTEIRWIADGEELVGDGLTVDLSNPKIKSYVRAQLVNADGVTATQPFGVVKDPDYRHPDDAPQGMEKLMWYAKMILTMNVFGWIAVNVAKLFN